jgi:GTP-binding protein
MMVKGSFRAVREADLVLLLVDASVGRLLDQEIKLAFYALENYKALMIVFNKQDLLDDDTKEKWEFNLSPLKYVIKKVSTTHISCKTGFGIGKMLTRIQNLWQRHSQQFSNDDLSILLKEALERKPLFHKTNELMLRTVHQVATAPITILLRVNQPDWFGDSQCAFFENLLRKKYGLTGVPIRFIVRKAR